MRSVKIAIVGAGSTYTPELIEGFILKAGELQVHTFALMDIHPEKLAVVGGFVRRMLAHAGYTGTVVLTASEEEALTGADYVLTQLRVGGLDARILDETLPLACGFIGQETTGAGGMMKGFRTIPVILRLARLMERLCPEAWLINFTNPAGMVTEAVLQHTRIRAVGLCNVPFSMMRDARMLLSSPDAAFDCDYAGLNHLSWITAVYENGRDILPERLRSDIHTSIMNNQHAEPFDAALLRAVAAIPSPYLHYFYDTARQLEHLRTSGEPRGAVCKTLESQLLEMYRDETLCEKPAMLEKRGGAYYSTVAVSLIDAIENDRQTLHVVNTRNHGTLPFLRHDDVAEVRCVVSRQGVTPLALRRAVPGSISGLIQSMKAYEHLAVSAAVTGSRETAVAALLVHPLAGDFHRAAPLLETMLTANRGYLPQFFPEVQP